MPRKFTFKRWFSHWCAYQLTALNLDIWRFKYLLHDIDKPMLNLFFSNKKVTAIHRKYNKHHIINGKIRDLDATIIDFECSRLTKKDAQMNARETYIKLYMNETPDFKSAFLHRLSELNL